MPQCSSLTVIFTFTSGVPECRLARPLAVLASVQAHIQESGLAPLLDGVYRYDRQAAIAQKWPTELWRHLYLSPLTGDISVLPPLEALWRQLPDTESGRRHRWGCSHRIWQQVHLLRLAVGRLRADPDERAHGILWENLADTVGALEGEYPQWVGDPWMRAGVHCAAKVPQAKSWMGTEEVF